MCVILKINFSIRNVNQHVFISLRTSGYMAAGLGKTEVIALGSILGVFAFLVSLGVAAYCYSNGKDNID